MTAPRPTRRPVDAPDRDYVQAYLFACERHAGRGRTARDIAILELRFLGPPREFRTLEALQALAAEFTELPRDSILRWEDAP